MCMSCRGNGHVDETRMENGKVWKERVTCKQCRGAGGKPGAGKHDHS
jgi:DnaJ-class molecular chaperone